MAAVPCRELGAGPGEGTVGRGAWAAAGGTPWGSRKTRVRRLGPTEGGDVQVEGENAELSQSQAPEGKGPIDSRDKLLNFKKGLFFFFF